jgi:hypothetical protein
MWESTVTRLTPCCTKSPHTSFQVVGLVPIAGRGAGAYAAPGYYPTEYRVYWNAGAKEYRVALSGLLRRG